MKRVKKIFLIIVVIFVGLLSGCKMLDWLCHDENIPRGYIDCVEYFDENGFQDYTDYCWYQYVDTDSIKLSVQYETVTKEKIPSIKGYFDDFQGWMLTENRLDQYDFDQTCINSGDFYYEDSEYGINGKYTNYNLYYFDKESAKLYFIHNNI